MDHLTDKHNNNQSTQMVESTYLSNLTFKAKCLIAYYVGNIPPFNLKTKELGSDENDGRAELCPDCHGSGSYQDVTCSSCNGKGVI